MLAVFPTVIRFTPALFSNMGGIGYNWPQGRNVTQYQLIDDLSKTVGAHNLKFGMNFHRIDMSILIFRSFSRVVSPSLTCSISTMEEARPIPAAEISRR